VKRCLDDGADALHADDEGFTALHMAAQEGFDAIATMLLRKGAAMDATDDDGVTPLMLACAGGHDAVVNMLLKERCDVMRVDKAGRSALFRAACVAGSEECSRALLAASADAFACPVEGKTMAEVAGKKSAACKLMLEDSISREGAGKRLLEACEAGRVAAVVAMLDGGAPIDFVDDDGWSGLHFAAAEGTPELCELLMGRGLKADTKAGDGETPLDLAEEEEHEEAVAALKASLE
jgi:ankyrin repeat protein